MPQSTTSAGRVDAAERRSETSQMKHLHAQPVSCISVLAFLVWRRARAVMPCLSRPVHAPWLSMHYAATRRLEHAHMTGHAYECVRKLQAHAQPASFAATGVLRALALFANMPHAYDDTSHARATRQAYT